MAVWFIIFLVPENTKTFVRGADGVKYSTNVIQELRFTKSSVNIVNVVGGPCSNFNHARPCTGRRWPIFLLLCLNWESTEVYFTLQQIDKREKLMASMVVLVVLILNWHISGKKKERKKDEELNMWRGNTTALMQFNLANHKGLKA